LGLVFDRERSREKDNPNPMNKPLLLALLSLTAICRISFAAGNQPATIDEVAKLTKPAPHSSAEVYEVSIEGVGSMTLKPQSGYESKKIFGEKFIYPTDFSAPEVTTKKDLSAAPSFPRNFINAALGYELKLRAKRVGSVIYLFGELDRKDFVRFNNGVGELSGEIISNDRRKTLTKNITNQPVFQTVSSRFVLSALPGKTYEIPVWTGKKFADKKVVVTVSSPKN
jgi:hypothetical protein